MKKKCREKQLHFANQWKSKPKSQIKSLFIYLFFNEWAKIWNTFFSIIKLNTLRVALLTQHLHNKKGDILAKKRKVK